MVVNLGADMEIRTHLQLVAMNLDVVCDVQEVADDQYLRLSDEKVLRWLSSKVDAVLAYKYPDLDVAHFKKLSMAASSDVAAGMTREEQIQAIKDADRALADKDRILFAVALVADYVPASWAEKLLLSFHLSLNDLSAKKKTAANAGAGTVGGAHVRPDDGFVGPGAKKQKIADGGKGGASAAVGAKVLIADVLASLVSCVLPRAQPCCGLLIDLKPDLCTYVSVGGGDKGAQQS